MALKGMLVDNADRVDLNDTRDVNERDSDIEQSKIVCPKCRKMLVKGSKFCAFCGASLNEVVNENKKLLDEASNLYKHDEPGKGSDGNEQIDKPADNTKRQIDDTVGAARKKVGTWIIILGVICGIGGFICSSILSDSYQPLDMYSGYRDPNSGELVIFDQGKIGGSYEGVAYYDNLKIYFIIGGFLISCVGMAFYSNGAKYERLPSTTRTGKVVGIDNFSASVEFEDGTREKLGYRPTIVMIAGDKGEFVIKGNAIIAFNKTV